MGAMWEASEAKSTSSQAERDLKSAAVYKNWVKLLVDDEIWPKDDKGAHLPDTTLSIYWRAGSPEPELAKGTNLLQ